MTVEVKEVCILVANIPYWLDWVIEIIILDSYWFEKNRYVKKEDGNHIDNRKLDTSAFEWYCAAFGYILKDFGFVGVFDFAKKLLLRPFISNIFVLIRLWLVLRVSLN